MSYCCCGTKLAGRIHNSDICFLSLPVGHKHCLQAQISECGFLGNDFVEEISSIHPRYSISYQFFFYFKEHFEAESMLMLMENLWNVNFLRTGLVVCSSLECMEQCPAQKGIPYFFTTMSKYQ